MKSRPPDPVPPVTATSFVDRIQHDASVSRLAAVVAPARPRTIACVVTHGMGQQVPFETVSLVGESFVAGRPPRSVNVDRVQLTPGANLISRIEIVYDPIGNTPETHVHLYECYWAPLTEGKITFFATLKFLVSGAWSGLKACGIKVFSAKPAFSRWIFGKLWPLPIKPGTASQLLLTVLVLFLALILAYRSEAALMSAYKVIKGHSVGDIWCIVLLSFRRHPFHILQLAVVLPASAAYVWVVRYAVVEYVGDVAIYVSSYKVSAYQDVRDAIQKTVFDIGRQIFSATVPTVPGFAGSPPVPGDPTDFLYDKVIFLGHSLGSVITYDLLDELIVWDMCTPSVPYNVIGRTSSLITFGSPLDKTAFLFRTQIKRTSHHYREALAALEQPLVLTYAFRTFPWTNLYSHMDVVSGKLLYYDIPGTSAPPAIVNLIDPGAWVPLLSHNQYWAGAALRNLLQAAIQ